MIDWVKTRLPHEWGETPVTGGHFLSLSPTGQVDRHTIKAAHVRGSHDEHLTLRTVERGFIEFDGNPSKFLQSHNLCGSDDLPGLVAAAARKAFAILGKTVDEAEFARWQAGDFRLVRVDVAQMFELETVDDVRAWLRAAGESASMRWRGRAKAVGEAQTIYFGKAAKGQRASTWSLKAYCKADELTAAKRSHRLPDRLPLRDELTAWVQNKLRVETMLRAQELKRYEDGRFIDAHQWNERTAAVIFNNYFSKMELGTNAMLTPQLEDELKPALRLAYTAWKDGHDLRGVLPGKTFYRYRRRLLDMTDGEIDLNVPQLKSNVVPLRRVLEIRPAAVPAFLVDRPDLLFRRAA